MACTTPSIARSSGLAAGVLQALASAPPLAFSDRFG